MGGWEQLAVQWVCERCQGRENAPCQGKQAHGFGLCLKRKMNERKEKVTHSELELRKQTCLAARVY